jgi:peptide/nickel transport system substrate-binding protein
MFALIGRGRCVALVLTLGVVAVGCSSPTSTSTSVNTPDTAPAPKLNQVGALVAGPADGATKEGGKLVYALDAEPEGLDPTRFAFTQAGHAVASAVFDPLATIDDNGDAVPYLATAFDHDASFTTWTITLPTGVTFHDGTPFDAGVAVTDLQAYKASAITGPGWLTVRSITASDPTHVVIGLTKANRTFPLVLTTQAGYMFAPVMLTDVAYAKKPIGTGPFVFDTHTDNVLWSFKKNPKYRRPGLPHLDAIDFEPIPDNAERNAKLKSSDVDIIQTYSGPQIVELRQSDFKRVENQHGDKSFLSLNTAQPPFDSLTARRAVASAVDAAKWRKDLRADVATPANSPFGPGQPGYLADNGYPSFDLARAKQLVAQYQQESGKPLAFTFTAASDTTNADIAQTFTSDFEAAGMKVTVEQIPQINLLAKVAFGGYQMSQFRLFGAPNPDAEVRFYASNQAGAGISLNFPRYSNPTIDAAIDTALSTADPSARDAAYQTVSKTLAEQVPYIWLGQEDWVIAANPSVNGIDGARNGSLPMIGPRTWEAELGLAA